MRFCANFNKLMRCQTMKIRRNRTDLSRRDFLAATVGTAAAIGLTGAVSLAQEQPKPAKKPLPVALQLYSVRMGAQKDMAGTIAAVAKMGYEGVEFAGYFSFEKDAKGLRKVLDDNNLKCCGTHAQWDSLSDANLEATIEFNKTIGNTRLIVPMLTVQGADKKAGWLEYAKRFNELADKVKPHGMRVGYHCHQGEFTKIDDMTPWDIVAGNAKPEVIMQLDTFWALSGGVDPATYVKKYPGRTASIHLKEWTKDGRIAMIGEGDTKWDELLTTCETIGKTEWYIVEEERSRTMEEAMNAVDKCLKGLKKLQAARLA
jgi:sugar phosphate isomerase/epimerase